MAEQRPKKLLDVDALRAERPKRLPTVLTKEEALHPDRYGRGFR